MTDAWMVSAFHEAGHVCGYLKLGWKFGTVKIWADGDGEVRGSVTSPAGRYDPFGKAICAVAGPVAEEHLTSVAVHDQPTSRTDLEMCRAALARVRLDPQLDEESVLPQARLLIEAEWPAIERVAAALFMRRELDYREGRAPRRRLTMSCLTS
jgi:hypothetical protein